MQSQITIIVTKIISSMNENKQHFKFKWQLHEWRKDASHCHLLVTSYLVIAEVIVTE